MSFIVGVTLPTLSALYYAWRPGRMVRGRWAAYCLGLGCCMVWLSLFLEHEAQPQIWTFNWIKVPTLLNVQISLDTSMTVRVLAAFVLLISWLVHLYSMDYFSRAQRKARYFMVLGAFTSSMLALLAAADLWSLIFFWSWIGLGSYLLIAHNYRKTADAKAAARSFLISKVAELGLLMLLLLLSTHLPRVDFEAMRLFFDEHKLWLSTSFLGLFCIWAAMGKSAQFPFQPWLLAAMNGPVPVSALLHSATLVIAGVLLLGRLSFLLTPELAQLLLLISLCGAAWAAVSASMQRHIKRLLAYSTISQVGLMMALLSLGQTQYALMYIIVHGTAKALLFLATGQISKQIKERLKSSEAEEVSSLGKLRHQLPLPYLACGCASVVLLGLPLGAAYELKHLLWAQIWAESGWYTALLMLVFLATALYVARLLGCLFLSPADPSPRKWYTALWTQRPAQQIPLWVCSIGCWAIFYQYPRLNGTSWLEGSMKSGLFPSNDPLPQALPFSATLLLGLPLLLCVLLLSTWRSYALVFAAGRIFAQPTYLERFYTAGWKALRWSAQQTRRLEEHILDGLLRSFRTSSLLLALAIHFIDRKLVDNSGATTARLLHRLGQKLSTSAQRHLPDRIGIVFVFFLLLLLIIYLLFF